MKYANVLKDIVLYLGVLTKKSTAKFSLIFGCLFFFLYSVYAYGEEFHSVDPGPRFRSYLKLSLKYEDKIAEFIDRYTQKELALFDFLSRQKFFKQILANDSRRKKFILTGPILFSMVEAINSGEDLGSFSIHKPTVVLNYKKTVQIVRL